MRVLARRASELLAETLGEVRLAVEADEVGDLGHRSRLVRQQLRRALQADRSNQQRRRLVGERAQLAMQLRAAQADLAPETLDVEVGSWRWRWTTVRTLVRKTSSIGVTAISLGLSTTGALKRSRSCRR